MKIGRVPLPNDPELGEGWAPPEKDRGAALIYKAYPKHVGRRSALRAIRVALNTRGLSFAHLLRRTREFADSVEHKRKTAAWKFVPYPATWFNRDGWEDEIETVVKTVQHGGPSRKEQATVDDRRRREDGAAWKWWKSLDMTERLVKRARWAPSLPEDHVMLHEFDKAGRPGFKE